MHDYYVGDCKALISVCSVNIQNESKIDSQILTLIGTAFTLESHRLNSYLENVLRH